MGTPDFSVGTLHALAEAGHEVVLAVTQPDKPKGRGGKVQFPPVKEEALALGIPVFQPKKISEPDCIAELRKYDADVMVVIAFGQILPKEVLGMTPYGCINVHASLLPKYRGAAPVQRCLLNGDTLTGVTIMRMEAGLDTGPTLLQQAISIHDTEENCHNAGSLLMDIAHSGATLLLEALEFIRNDDVTLIKQNDELATHAAKLTKQEAQIDFTKPSLAIHNHVRGFSPNPGATANLIFEGKDPVAVRIEAGYPLERLDFEPTAEQENANCGEILGIFKNYIVVKCENSFYGIRQLRLAGKPSMDAKSFQNGYLRNNSHSLFALLQAD